MRQVMCLWNVCLMPTVGLYIGEGHGTLVVSEHLGVPHCIAVRRVSDIPSLVDVWDGTDRLRMSIADIEARAADATDRKTIVSFTVYQPGERLPADRAGGTDSHDRLLDLQAGASTDNNDDDLLRGICVRVLPEGEDSDAEEDANAQTSSSTSTSVDEGSVSVGSDLLRSLSVETQRALREVLRRDGRLSEQDQVCPLCPFRRFERRARLVHHLRAHHTASRQFVCSGTKQVRVVAALFDDDSLTGRSVQNRLLQRSAEILRRSVTPALSGRHNFIDKQIRLCLEGDGPHYRSYDAVLENPSYRRARNLFYNMDFAVALRADILMHGTKVKGLIPHMHRRSAERGNHLSSLLPTHVSHWWPIVEDVFNSPAVLLLEKCMFDQLVLHDELDYISVDATLRVTMTIMGQRPPRMQERGAHIAVFVGADEIRRVITVRGRTGAVLAIWPAQGESAAVLTELFRAKLTTEMLAKVRFVAHDDPSALLYRSFRDIMPNLRMLCLDTVHLPMVYEYGFWRSRTAGSSLLRRIMGKFTPRSLDIAVHACGPAFHGNHSRDTDFEEEVLRRHIRESTLPLPRARAVLEKLDFTRAFTSRVDFAETLAALSAVHSDEMSKMVPGPNRVVGEILASAVHPTRVEHHIKQTHLTLSGTCSQRSPPLPIRTPTPCPCSPCQWGGGVES